MPAIKRLRSQAWPAPTGFEKAGLFLNLTTLPHSLLSFRLTIENQISSDLGWCTETI